MTVKQKGSRLSLTITNIETVKSAIEVLRNMSKEIHGKLEC